MRDPFIIDPDHDSGKDCPKCQGTGHLHKRGPFQWEGCERPRVGGRCCDWENKTCPKCNGTGQKKVKPKVTKANTAEKAVIHAALAHCRASVELNQAEGELLNGGHPGRFNLTELRDADYNTRTVLEEALEGLFGQHWDSTILTEAQEKDYEP